MEPVRLTEVPTPKWAIGAQVWCSRVEWGQVGVECPDCLGSGKWKVESPAGYHGEVNCPRCSGGGKVKSETRVGKVQLLTIGSVRIDTAATREDGPVSYMCVETGVGSGSIWYEGRLFGTSEEAQADADARAAVEWAQVLETAHGRKVEEMRELNTYQLKDAEVKAAEKAAWSAGYDLRKLIERICELGEDTYLMSSGFDEEAEAEKRPTSGSLGLKGDMVRLLQEHLVSYNDAAAQALREWRAEAERCKC